MNNILPRLRSILVAASLLANSTPAAGLTSTPSHARKAIGAGTLFDTEAIPAGLIDAFTAVVGKASWLRRTVSVSKPPFPLKGWLGGDSASHLIPEEALLAGQRLCRFLALREIPLPSKIDGLLIFGSDDERVAEEAAKLYLEHSVSWVLISGGMGRTSLPGSPPEAERFKEIMIQRGVPAAAITTETKASNSGENARFSLDLMREKGLRGHVLLLQKPQDERRALATLKKEQEKLGIDRDENTIIKAYAPFIPDFNKPAHNWRTEEWEPKLQENVFNEVWRLLEYPGKGFIMPVIVSLDILHDAVTTAEDLITNSATPSEARLALGKHLDDVRAALRARIGDEAATQDSVASQGDTSTLLVRDIETYVRAYLKEFQARLDIEPYIVGKSISDGPVYKILGKDKSYVVAELDLARRLIGIAIPIPGDLMSERMPGGFWLSVVAPAFWPATETMAARLGLTLANAITPSPILSGAKTKLLKTSS